MSSTLAPAASKLALLGGTPVGKVTYPKFPTFTDRAIERAADMLRQGKLFGLGRKHVPEIGEAGQLRDLVSYLRSPEILVQRGLAASLQTWPVGQPTR